MPKPDVIPTVPKDPTKPGTDIPNTPPDDGSGEKGEKDPAPKTFTQEEVDRIAGERAKRTQEKANKDLEDKIRAERADWDRQAKLSAEERDQEEAKRREQESKKREETISLRENRAEARELLLEKSIPSSVVDFVVDIDPDKTKENIEKFESVYLKAVEEGVTAKLAGTTPTAKDAPPTNEKLSTRDLVYGRK